MAIKNRILKNLDEAENNLNNFLYDFSLKNLNTAKNLCQTGLSKKNFIAYEEIYDGLVLALKTLIENPNTQKIIDLSIEFLTYLKIQTVNEKNFKKEIVFLPVQAAMWDSLESVWKEAFEDTENCISYVIPLPYANLNKDHSIRDWNCDIEKYPSYVPVIYYKNIDLKEIRPDIVFINNPYDEMNYITRVNSDYYVHELKKICDKLIYIPYFILDEPVKEENLEHFVMTNGAIYSDMVILQSEILKKQYIKILLEKTPWKDKEYWEKRIIAVGSPKVDKVLNSKKSDFVLPEKWKKLIEGKKVVLYVTSFSPQISNADKILNKMISVFNAFKNRKDMVLWWRPHPLLKESMRAMLPIIEKYYVELEEEYIREGFGIYDDTGDLHRAICYSDAYYGDVSSVATLYKYTGKPIMFENFIVV